MGDVMTIQGTRGDGVRMVSFTEMELRARDEAIIRATTRYWMNFRPDESYEADFDAIITAAEREPST